MNRLYDSGDSDEEGVVEMPNPHHKPTIHLKEWLHSFKPNNSESIK